MSCSAMHPASFKSFQPPAATSAGAGRWVQVVSHLDPRYGGLSAAVPELGRALARGLGGEPTDISLAAFCAPGEHFQPAGFSPDEISYWPAARKPWLCDHLHGHGLRDGFRELVREACGLHVHGLWEQSTSIAAETARSLKVPYVLSTHGMLEPWALANKRLKKLLYATFVERKNVAGARCLHALTRAEAEQYVAFGARSPIAIIPNAVEVPAQADPSLFLKKHATLQGKRLVLFLARLHAKKGLDLLLDAWEAVAGKYPDAHLVIAGPDSEGTLARLQQVVSNKRLERSVCFAGMLRGAMKWSALAAAEAFVLPSYSEGLSVSVLEAMGMGLPVIITDPCHMPEVEAFEAGWQIQPNLDQLASALGDLLRREPEENRETGTRGAYLVQTRYTWPIVAKQMSEVYSWALGGTMPASVNLVFPA